MLILNDVEIAHIINALKIGMRLVDWIGDEIGIGSVIHLQCEKCCNKHHKSKFNGKYYKTFTFYNNGYQKYVLMTSLRSCLSFLLYKYYMLEQKCMRPLLEAWTVEKTLNYISFFIFQKLL